MLLVSFEILAPIVGTPVPLAYLPLADDNATASPGW